MRPPRLTDSQKRRLRTLEPQLKEAIRRKNLEEAKRIASELQAILRPTGHMIRLIEAKNRLYELAIDLNKTGFAKLGLESNLKVTNSNTRTNLEALSLYAICLLRENKIEKAKPIIKKVLKNDKVIKSERTRALFRKEIIDRFNEEITLCSLREEPKQQFTEDEVDIEVMTLLQSNNEQEIYEKIGNSTPEYTKYNLLQIHEFSTKQLPSAERKALPSPDAKAKPKEVGKTVFKSVKRVLYNSLCDPESEIYQSWYENGMKTVLSKRYIHGAVIATLGSFGIGIKLLIASIVALIIKFGIEVYCDRYKPQDIMLLRGK